MTTKGADGNQVDALHFDITNGTRYNEHDQRQVMKKGDIYHREQKTTAALYLFVPIALFCIFFLYSIGYTVYLSFFKWNGLTATMKFVGLFNFGAVFQNDQFVYAFLNNVKWLVFFVIFPPGIGLGLALLVNRLRRSQGVFQAIFYVPNVITPIAVGAIWTWVLNPKYGLINTVLNDIGLGVFAQNWLGQPNIAVFSMMFVASWAMCGLPFVLYLAGLRTVPAYLLEAAEIDGANAFVRFLRIILPMLSPTTIIVEAFSILGAIRLFDLVYALTNGFPDIYDNVLALFMFKTSFQILKMGQDAAIAVILFLFTVFVLGPYLVISTRRAERVRM